MPRKPLVCALCGKVPENPAVVWGIKDDKQVRQVFCHPDDGVSCYSGDSVGERHALEACRLGAPRDSPPRRECPDQGWYRCVPGDDTHDAPGR